MKTKLLLIATMLVLSLGSCAPCYCVRHDPIEYRTYQDENHGGIDDQHGRKYSHHMY